MTWRGDQEACRRRTVEKYDADEVEAYDSLVGTMSREDEDAVLADLDRVVALRSGMRVLDVGAGTGTVSGMLSRIEGLRITALEPAPAMLDRLRSKPGLEGVRAVEGFCDAPGDRTRFEEASFDVIASRQVGNVLFDPLSAFRNWHHWLAPGGAVVLMDGFYTRTSWTGRWEEEADMLPLSCNQSMALIPYLMESVGFLVVAAQPMAATNARPTTRTPRYVVVARTPEH